MNFEKLKPTTAAVIVFSLGIFFLVILAFFLLNRPLFFSLNMWQLIGIGLGISIPIYSGGVFLSLVYDRENSKEAKEKEEVKQKEDKEEEEIIHSWAGSLLAIFLMTPTLIICYWQQVSLRNYFFGFFTIYAVALGGAFLKQLFKKKEKKESSK